MERERGESQPKTILDKIKDLKVDLSVVDIATDPQQKWDRLLLVVAHNRAIDKVVELIKGEVEGLENPFLKADNGGKRST